MKRFLLFFVLMILPAVSRGDIASTTYVDNSMPGMATADTAGIVKLDDEFKKDSTNPVQTKVLMDSAVGPVTVTAYNAMQYAELLAVGKQQAINPSQRCQFEKLEGFAPEEWGEVYTRTCDSVDEANRARGTLVGIDDFGQVVPTELKSDETTGNTVSDISVDKNDNIVVSRKNIDAATRDAAGIAPLGTIPSGATGAGTATIWIE